MPKISLWKPVKAADYDYTDQLVQENLELGATGIYVHKYLGPANTSPSGAATTTSSTDTLSETTIQDVLFLENRDRKYEPNVYELRGAYTVVDNDFDLSQFGLFFATDTIFMNFHLNDMVDRLGRKLMAGDVIELPHLRDQYLLDETKPAINRFFVIMDGNFLASGFSARWWPHIWRIRAQQITDSPEYADIFGDGSNPNDLKNTVSTYNTQIGITDAIVAEAEENVQYDPLFFKEQHLYVVQDPATNQPAIVWASGTGIPPNGAPVAGQGTSFPTTLNNGDYFLRTDYMPPTLFQKQGNLFQRISVDMRQLPWTGTNKVLDTFLYNENTTTNNDGSTEPERQALSKVIKPKADIE